MTDEIRAAIERAGSYLTEHPDEARYTDSVATARLGMRAAQLGLTGFTCEVEVDSDSDDRGILGLDPNVSAGPLGMRVGIRLSADGAEAGQLAGLATWAVEHCPTADAVRRAIPVRVEVDAG